MKHSGIPWIGEIPKDWKIERLKQKSDFLNGYAFNSDDFRIDEGVRVIRIGDIGLKVDFDNCVRAITDKTNLTPFKIKDGDILIAMSGATTGKCCIVDKAEEAYANQRVGIIRSNINGYVYYSLQTPYFMEFVNLNNAGSAQPNISSKDIGEFPILSMPFSEQQKIASYLDKKCSEIDEMVVLQEKIIEELKAYKQSVITEAVTKGLNPDVPMKDSEIMFVDKIPSHWKETKTLRLLSMPITDGPHETPECLDDGIPFISADAVSDGYINFNNKWGYISKEYYEECCKKYIPQRQDIYMIKSGASTGRTAIVETDEVFTIWSPLAVFRANKEVILPHFLLYVLRSDSYQKQVESKWSFGTQQNIGMRTLEKLFISYPSVSEQQAIADYLEEKCADIDNLIQIKQSKIESLKEYKKSIIYEYVTGKKEVE